MTWLGVVVIIIGLYLAFRLAGVVVKIALFALALVGVYWLAAPHMGWPTVSELVYVLGPDFEGRRIEEVVDPSRMAKEATSRVVDGVVDGVFDRFDPRAEETPEAVVPEGGATDPPSPDEAGDETRQQPAGESEAP